MQPRENHITDRTEVALLHYVTHQNNRLQGLWRLRSFVVVTLLTVHISQTLILASPYQEVNFAQKTRNTWPCVAHTRLFG